MNAIELLAEALKTHPGLAELPWRVDSTFAMASLEDLGQMGSVPDPDNPGQRILKIKPPPRAVPIVNALHAAGWKRGDFPQGFGFWVVYADLKREGAHLRVAGLACAEDRDVGHDNTAVPFFAPLPPELPARGRVSKAFKVEYREWERKCQEDEW